MSIDIDILYLIAMLMAAVLGFLIAFRWRSDMKRFAPESFEIMMARKNKIPLAIVWKAANSFDMFIPVLEDGILHLRTKTHDYGVCFDPIAENDVMQHSGDGLTLFNVFSDHVEAITPLQAKAIPGLAELRPSGVSEEIWWEVVRMNEQELRNNAELLGIKSEEELEEILKLKRDEIEPIKVKSGTFAFQQAMKVLNPAHSAGHLLNLQSAWFKKGAAGMLDESKLKIIIFAAVAFAIIIMSSVIAFTML